MFERWDNFYLLIGGAAGSLIGLLFIVATLNRGRRDADSALRGASIYMTPIVQHLAVVLVVSALASAPAIPAEVAALIIGAVALVALASAGQVIWHLQIAKSMQTTHWSDVWWYGIAALLADLALAGYAATLWLVSPVCAARGIAVSLVLILLIAVRNAWDLVTWITAKGAGASG